MSDLAGKEKRVMGTFVLMVGSGLVLESPVGWIGAVLMTLGIATMLWGSLEGRPETQQPQATDTAAVACGDAERSR